MMNVMSANVGRRRVGLFLACVIAGFLAFTLAPGGPAAYAQDIEPRTYSNAPIGVNFLIAGYVYTDGGLASDPSLPLTNPQVRTDTWVLGYARSIDVLGRSGKFDVVLPYGSFSGSGNVAGQPEQREMTGFGDPRLRFSVNFYGAPALTLAEFADYQQDLILGASVQVSVPLGQYDDTKVINLGNNRWFVKPEIGASKAVGRWTLEITAAATFFTDNNDFYGGKTRAQDPIYSTQGHVIYSFQSGIWAALDATYFNGGRTTIDGVKGNDLIQNSRVGLTVALPVDRRNSVKLYASRSMSTSIGGNYDLYGVAWQYRWGAGL